MNDFELFKKTFEKRLDELEDFIINDGSGIELGRSPEWIKKQFKWTKVSLFGINQPVTKHDKDNKIFGIKDS